MKKVRSKLHPTEIGVIKTFSLSPDDEVGEIAVECSGCTYYYNNLAELCEKWEDYEEPVESYWFINDLDGELMKCDLKNCGKSNFTEWSEHRKEIGNYFETKEEAELAVCKLKAFKRLKDKGFTFYDWVWDYTPIQTLKTTASIAFHDGIEEDLDLLFGGEE